MSESDEVVLFRKKMLKKTMYSLPLRSKVDSKEYLCDLVQIWEQI